jgi:AcrR family transcriptional regulator
MSETVAPNPHRNAGRPRASGVKASPETRRQILDAAAALFVRRGFAGASTQAIAAAAGLRQPTLFHYFPTKDAILEALYMASLDEPLAAFAHIEALPAPAPVRLYAAIHADTAFLSATAVAQKAIFLLPELGQPRFSEVRAARERLIATYARLIAQGIEGGDFRPGDADLLARLVMSLDEAPIDIAAARPSRESGEQARMVADFALQALLLQPARLDKIRAEGLALLDLTRT